MSCAAEVLIFESEERLKDEFLDLILTVMDDNTIEKETFEKFLEVISLFFNNEYINVFDIKGEGKLTDDEKVVRAKVKAE